MAFADTAAVEISERHSESWHWVSVSVEKAQPLADLDGQFSISELLALTADLAKLQASIVANKESNGETGN